MGNKRWEDDLEFSQEELSDLDESLENRSRTAPSGRPRRRTNRGLRVPSDVVPRRRQSEAEEGLDLDLSPGPLIEQAKAAPPAAEDDFGSAEIALEPEDAPTEPMLPPLPTTLPGVAPGGLESHDTPPDDQSALIVIPPAQDEPSPEAKGALEPLSSSIDLAEAEAFDEEETFVEQQAEQVAERDDAADATTEQIPTEVAREAVRRVLEVVGTPARSLLADDVAAEFDNSASDPGVVETLERLARHRGGAEVEAGERPENENDRANRVAILLSALKTPTARKDAANALASLESEQAEAAAKAPQPKLEQSEMVPAPLAGNTASAPLGTVPAAQADAASAKAPQLGRFPSVEITLDQALEEEEQPAPTADVAPAEELPAADQRQEAQGGALERGPSGELEELSGEELEELSGEQDAVDDDQTVPPPIPAGAPSADEAEDKPQAVTVPVAEDEDVMTSAPPEPLSSPEVREPARGPQPPSPPAALPAVSAVPPAAPAAPGDEERAGEMATAAAGWEAQAAAAPPAQEVSQAERPPIPALARGRKRKKTWFEEIFDEDWLRTIPHIPPAHTCKEVDFLETSLQPAKDSQVLDLGCGEGRHAIEFASRGYQITGYDLSLPLLIRAADEAQRRQLKVNFVHGDFRELSFAQEFDAVYCLFTSFGYFDDDSNRKFIQSINQSLRVGGRLMLDVINRDYIIQDVPARIWWEGRGCVVLEEVDFNFFTSRIISKRSVVFEDGRHLEQEISVRSYSLHELGKILHHAGFRVLEVSGHLAHRTRFFGKDSRSLTLLAEKRAR